MKVVTTYNNFARGKIDHDMMGRFDLPIYQSGSDVLNNFFTNFKGNAIYRTGFEDMLGVAFQDCAFYEFRFSNNQNYLMVFYNTKIRFLSYDVAGNFGWVLDAGLNILEVTTPWTLAQSKQLSVTQNADVMIITHNSATPKRLTRVSANNFTLVDHTYTGGTAPFGAGQFPSHCLFHKGRLYFANTLAKTTTIWGSEAGNFNNFVIPMTLTDKSPIQFTVSEITQPIDWLFSGDNSLIAGSADGIVAINGGGVGTAIKADSVEANLTSADGSNLSYPFKKDGLIFYVGRNNRNMYYFSYDLLTESFTADDANILSYDITRGNISKIRHKKDRNDLIYSVRGDGVLLSLNFKDPKSENIIGWHTHRTKGLVKDIATITDNDGNPQLFALVLRGVSYFIERMADHVQFVERTAFFTNGDTKQIDDEAYNRVIAEQLRQCNYLDNSQTVDNLKSVSITYNPANNRITASSASFVSGDVGKDISYKTVTGSEKGRFRILSFISTTVVEVEVLQEPHNNTYALWYLSFSTISGLSKFNGETIGVVADGGYLSDFIVTGGVVNLGQQVLSAVVGYKYTGVIKSFCLGFQSGAVNTQTTMKAISRVGMRTVSSAGGKFGSSLYKLENVQRLSQNDLNYLPPIPMDGTTYCSYVDDNEIDKFFYIVQDQPLPLVITSVMIDAHYSGG